MAQVLHLTGCHPRLSSYYDVDLMRDLTQLYLTFDMPGASWRYLLHTTSQTRRTTVRLETLEEVDGPVWLQLGPRALVESETDLTLIPDSDYFDGMQHRLFGVTMLLAELRRRELEDTLAPLKTLAWCATNELNQAPLANSGPRDRAFARLEAAMKRLRGWRGTV